MSLKSIAQLRRLEKLVKEGKLRQEKLDEWVKNTPNINSLPDRVGSNKVKSVKKARVL